MWIETKDGWINSDKAKYHIKRDEIPNQEWENYKSAFSPTVGFYDFTNNKSAQGLLYFSEQLVIVY